MHLPSAFALQRLAPGAAPGSLPPQASVGAALLRPEPQGPVARLLSRRGMTILIAKRRPWVYREAPCGGLSRLFTKAPGFLRPLKRMLSAPGLHPLVHRKILEYIEEKNDGRYGSTRNCLRRFNQHFETLGRAYPGGQF